MNVFVFNRYEGFFGKFSSANICVTKAMKEDLKNNWNIKYVIKMICMVISVKCCNCNTIFFKLIVLIGWSVRCIAWKLKSMFMYYDMLIVRKLFWCYIFYLIWMWIRPLWKSLDVQYTFDNSKRKFFEVPYCKF